MTYKYITISGYVQFVGCGKCYAVDGNWKLTFPHCMFPVKSFFQFSGLNYADVCPDGNSVFCFQHLSLAKTYGYPTKIIEFVNFCKAKNSNFYSLFSYCQLIRIFDTFLYEKILKTSVLITQQKVPTCTVSPYLMGHTFTAICDRL